VPRLTREEAVAALNGVVVPMITPVREDHSFDAAAMTAHIEYLIGAGVHALFPCSATGKFDLFSTGERRAIITTVVKATAGRVAVFAGIDCRSPQETIDQAKWAEQVGVDAVVVIPLGRKRGRRRYGRWHERRAEFANMQDRVVDFMRRLHDEVGCYIIIHDTSYSKWSNPEIFPETYSKLTELPRIIGLKKSTRDVSVFPALHTACRGHLAVTCGNEYVYLGALSMGASHGIVGGGANVYPQLLLKLRRCYLAGDLTGALAAQTRINEAAKRLSPIRNSRTIALQGLGIPIVLDRRPEPVPTGGKAEDGYANDNRWYRDADRQEREEIQDYVRSLIAD